MSECCRHMNHGLGNTPPSTYNHLSIVKNIVDTLYSGTATDDSSPFHYVVDAYSNVSTVHEVSE